MPKRSAGIVPYRRSGQKVEVLLVHPGGPFWAKRDAGAWSIPKGEFTDGEDPFAAAKREFAEELGHPVPEGELIELGEAKQSSGKIVHAWAIASDFDAKSISSNTFKMEWPPHSGQEQEFPEVDKAGWFPLAKAGIKIVKGQVPLIEVLATKLGASIATPEDEPEAQQTQLL